jgi:hypothetical protein
LPPGAGRGRPARALLPPPLVMPGEPTDLGGASGSTIVHSHSSKASNMRLTSKLLLALTAALALGLPGAARAQEMMPIAHFTVAAGLFQWELEGSGLAPLLAVRAGTPVSTVLLLEGSVIGARPGQDSGTSTVLIPEGQFQLAIPFTGVNPYMGLGGGAVVDFGGGEDGGTGIDMTISASLGLRAWFGDRFGIVAEFRGRGIGTDFDRTSAEYTFGGSLRR